MESAVAVAAAHSEAAAPERPGDGEYLPSQVARRAGAGLGSPLPGDDLLVGRVLGERVVVAAFQSSL